MAVAEKSLSRTVSRFVSSRARVNCFLCACRQHRLTPVSCPASPPPFCFFRVGLGLGEGFAFPSVHAMIAETVPKGQRSTVVRHALAQGRGWVWEAGREGAEHEIGGLLFRTAELKSRLYLRQR